MRIAINRSGVSMAVLLVASVVGCGSSSKPAGSERGPCYGNNSCNAGLVCLSQVCVNPGGAGGASGSGGTAGTSGASVADASADSHGAAGDSGAALIVGLTPPTVTAELGTTNVIAIAVSASEGFVGHVNLAASLSALAGSDAGASPLAGWTITLDTPGVDIPAGGMATAHATVTIPTENHGLAAIAKVVATTSADGGTAPASATASFTVLNQYTIAVTLDSTGKCVYPAPGTTDISVGSTLRWLNDTSVNIVIQIEGSTAAGCSEESPSPGTAPGATYDCKIIAVSSFNWYCHAPGNPLEGLIIQTVQ